MMSNFKAIFSKELSRGLVYTLEVACYTSTCIQYVFRITHIYFMHTVHFSKLLKLLGIFSKQLRLLGNLMLIQ